MSDVTDLLYREGTKLALKEEYRDAIIKFVEILNIDPLDDRTWVAKGVCHTHLKEYQEAYKSFSEALKINPNNKQALDNQDIISKYIDLEMPGSFSKTFKLEHANFLGLHKGMTLKEFMGFKNDMTTDEFMGFDRLKSDPSHPLNVISSKLHEISVYQVSRALILGALGGFGIGSILFPIFAFIFLQWPFLYIFGMFVIWLIIGGIILTVVGHFWKKTESGIKAKLEPVYALAIIATMIGDLIISISFYKF